TRLLSSATSAMRRPMKRLIENTVFLGFVTAWRFATVPTRRSPSLVNATTEGVVRPPSALGITTGSPPSITETTELVVPRSMPMILDAILRAFLVNVNRQPGPTWADFDEGSKGKPCTGDSSRFGRKWQHLRDRKGQFCTCLGATLPLIRQPRHLGGAVFSFPAGGGQFPRIFTPTPLRSAVLSGRGSTPAVSVTELQLPDVSAKESLRPPVLLSTLNWKATFFVPFGIAELGKVKLVARFWLAFPRRNTVCVLVAKGVAP